MSMFNLRLQQEIYCQCAVDAAWHILQLSGGRTEKTEALTTWGASQHPVSQVAGGCLKCWGLCYALCSMWMACPDQDGTLQGQCGVSCNDLADNDAGTGSGWQQNKQNCTVPSVVG